MWLHHDVSIFNFSVIVALVSFYQLCLGFADGCYFPVVGSWGSISLFLSFFFFFLDFIYFYIEGKDGEIEGQKHQCVFSTNEAPTGDLSRNPGMCLDWELNR